MTDFDAIVVGSGISGGWAAKELAERGLSTLVLERGKPQAHGDYPGEHKPPWEVPHGGLPLRDLYDAEYEVQRQCYAFDETTRHFWNNDADNPYVYEPDKPFTWIRADVVGGRSLMWARQCYRWSDLDFEANRKDGHGVDWPIRYADVAPWYSHVERFIGVSGEARGFDHLPDGEFQKPMEMNVVEQFVAGHLETEFGRPMTIGRTATLTEPLPGRAACHYCGPCHRGCSAGAYFSSQSSTLPAAEATGRFELRANAVVEGLDYDAQTGRVSGVRVIDTETRVRETVTARVVFLCASTIGSAQIMLNSRSESFPDGIANRSGALGRYLMDHCFQAGAMGVMPGFDDYTTYGNRPNGIYVPRFRNLDGQDDVPFVRGYGYQGGARRLNWRSMQGQLPGFGAPLKEALIKPGPWVMSLGGFGECLPRASNRMVLDDSRRDRFGIPQVRFEFEWSDNERAILADIVSEAERMLTSAGAQQVRTYSNDAPGGLAIHEMGTVRMGHDPSTSVLNGHNQAHDVANLFVTDGACMTSSSCVNPSVTYMALTARAAEYAVTQVQAGAI